MTMRRWVARVENVSTRRYVEWEAFTQGSCVFDRLFFSTNGSFLASPANRLELEEVGVPVFDY